MPRWCGSRPTPPAATCSRTPSSSTPSIRTWALAVVRGLTGPLPKRSRCCVATALGYGSGELAHHWFSATQTVDVSKAVRFSREAGDAALEALAPGDAVRHYGRALDLYSNNEGLDPVLEVDLMIGLGTAQRQTGDPAFRESLLAAARRAADLGDTDRLVAAVLANDRGFYSAVGAIDSDKVAILERATELVSDDTPDRALVLATLCSELAYGSPLDRRRALADEAVAIARTLDDDEVIVRVFNHVHVALQVPSLLDESLERTAEALVRAERIGDPVQIFWSAHWRATDAARRRTSRR